jgi:transposase
VKRPRGVSLASATAVLPQPEQLPDDLATLKQMILELLATLAQERHDKDALRHRLDLLLRRLYGPRSERFDPNQPVLFADMVPSPDAAGAVPAEPAAAAQPQRRCRPHGRRRLPENLPREPRHYELSEAERLCQHCGQRRIDIGVDKSEQLNYRPASLYVIEHVVHKYVCPGCSPRSAPALSQPARSGQEVPTMPARPTELSLQPGTAEPPTAPGPTGTLPEPVAARPQSAEQEPPSPVPPSPCPVPTPIAVVIAAPRPPLPIAKGLPGPGLLAHLIVSKCVDHLPLHRLERVYERQGFFLHRSTLCDWMAASAQLLRPLYDLLVSAVLQSRALHTDDTTVKMQELMTHLLITARLWVYLGDAAHPYNVFDFTLNHKRDGPQQFLAQYQGYLHADAFSGYDGLYLPDPRTAAARIVEVACNAHARRKFYEARGSDALRAHQALAYYRQLYELERQAKDFSDAQRQQMRQELAVPILNQFRTWLEAQRVEVLPKSPMAEALGYALNHWTALVRYSEAGFLSIDNNVSEREMKRIAIGRKNWLTVGSPRGGQTAAVLLSFTSTCQRLGVEPWRYLRDVLERLPSHPAERLADLLPDVWARAYRGVAGAEPPGQAPPSSSG